MNKKTLQVDTVDTLSIEIDDAIAERITIASLKQSKQTLIKMGDMDSDLDIAAFDKVLDYYGEPGE
jgi:hypothetical protein